MLFSIGYKELNALSSDGVYSMSHIEWWLLKHENNYSDIMAIEDVKNTVEFEGDYILLPSLKSPPSEEGRFLCLYEALDKLSRLHTRENYFKQEMAIYKGIVKEPLKLSEWLKKNQRLGTEDYACFLVDYLDYDINNNEYHLNVFLLNDVSKDLYVDREDFKYTIEFLEIFNDIYL